MNECWKILILLFQAAYLGSVKDELGLGENYGEEYRGDDDEQEEKENRVMEDIIGDISDGGGRSISCSKDIDDENRSCSPNSSSSTTLWKTWNEDSLDNVDDDEAVGVQTMH